MLLKPIPDLVHAFLGVDLLRRIGTLLHFSAHGHIIARVKQVIKLGTQLFTSNSKPVGRVIEVFGPTVKPFVALKPASQVTIDTVPPGTTLFQAKSAKGGREKRRKK